jgi:2-iminobutanoate/2-iminopropanoate deaminase
MRKSLPFFAAIFLAIAVTHPGGSQQGTKRIVTPEGFPSGRPYSAGVLSGGTLYVAGQVGSDWKSGQFPENFEDEVRQCLANVQAILKAGGMDFADVVSTQVYLTDMGMFERMNAVYTGAFKEPRPARTTVGVAKLVGPAAHIEITVTARK